MPNSSQASASSHAKPIRVRRIKRACDRCHRSNAKCAPGPNTETCRPCFEFGESCTYARPERRRGPRPVPGSSDPLGHARDKLNSTWQYQPLVEPGVIEILVEGYHPIVYPIFPLFHWPTFIQDVRHQRYTADRSFYTVVMVVCAIVAARLRNGALLSSSSPSTLANPQHSSETFHRLALQAFPMNLTDAPHFNYKRAKALLAILSIQYGDVANLHTHLGDYETLSLNEGFYDEGKWPPGLKAFEVQERRRLFWSTYTLEIFAAITWGGLVRQRQSQTNVLYPAEVYDDDCITNDGYILPENPASGSFLHGWNITTDMYRVLEHLVDRLRSRKFQQGSSSVLPVIPERINTPTSAEVLNLVEGMYDTLDPVFKNVRAMVGIVEIDRFGFQAFQTTAAANLIVTLQTVKMALAGTEESSVDQRCAIAGTLLDALAAIPTSYIASISAPMLHHLASVGHLLSNIIQQSLSPWSFLQIRNVLSALADLISGLESVLSVSSDISTRLKSHVAIIDDRLNSGAAQAARAAADHNLISEFGSAPSTLLSSGLMGGQNSTRPAGEVQPPDDMLDWLFALSPEHQMQLQSDLTSDWPLDMGLGGSFDFWSNGQGSVDMNAPNQS